MEVKLPGHINRTRKRLDKAIRACTDINAGMTTAEVAKKYGVSQSCIYQWKDLVVAHGNENA